MRRFEYRTGKSNKFWQIAVHAKSYTVQYGKIGSAGRSATNDLDLSEKAQQEASRKIVQKIEKGYVEVPVESAIQFQPIYLVRNAIVPVRPAEIDELEQTIGSLPHGYREFMHRCGGEGSLCDDISIWSPDVIMQTVASEREYMTFDHCLRWEKKLEGLIKSDFDDIWVFGSDGIGSSYAYFPRHQGTLFNLLHGGGVVRHDRAFCDIAGIWARGVQRFRHTFPFFEPTSQNRRKIRGFEPCFDSPTRLQAAEVARLIATYWEELGERAVLKTMTPQSDDDESPQYYVFVKRLGFSANVTADQKNHPGEVLGYLAGEYEHRSKLRDFSQWLQQSMASI